MHTGEKYFIWTDVMRKYGKILLICLTWILIGGLPQVVIAQTLNERSEQTIKRQGKFLVEEFQKLLINLSNINNSEADIEKIIYNNTKGDKIFWDENITIEDDINPKFTQYENPLDKRIEDYLNDFDIYYTKSATGTIEFDSLLVSDVLRSDEGYWYVKVLYQSRFLNKHRDFLIPYPKRRRVAEIRADEKSVGWNSYISSIRFWDDTDTTTYQEFDFLPEVIEEKFDQLEAEAAFWLNRGAYEKTLEVYQQAYALKPNNSELVQKIEDLEDKVGNISTRERYFDISDYTEYLESNPKDADGYMGRGKEYMENGDYAASVADFNRAIKYNPNLLDAYIQKGNAFVNMATYASAAESYEEAQRLNPDNLELVMEVARLWHLAGNFRKEAEVLTEAIVQFPEEARLYQARMYAQFALRDYKATSEDLQILTFLRQDSALYWYQLGQVYALLESNADADSCFQVADSLNSVIQAKAKGMERAYYTKAAQEFERENYIQCADQINRLLLLNPKNTDAYLLRGKAYIEEDMYRDALIDLSTVIATTEDAEAYLYRGRAALALGNLDDAKTDLLAAVRTNPELCKTYNELAEIHLQENENQEAIQRYTDGLGCKYQQPDVHQKLAELYMQQSSFQKAENSAFNAINLLKNDKPLDRKALSQGYLLLGKIQVKLDKYREAIDQYQNVVKYDEFNPEAYRAIGEFYQKYYGESKGQKYLEKAEELERIGLPEATTRSLQQEEGQK